MLDNTEPGFLWDLFRTFLSMFDRIIYQLLVWIYEVFFAVSRYEIFKTDTITALFNRVFLILGIFMLFKLAFSLLSSIVNPDQLTDKEKGFGKIVTRVLMMIALLMVLLPLNIPNPSNTFEEKLNSHGLLFGTLYTMQDRVLSSNVIGKIVLNNQEQLPEDPNDPNKTQADLQGDSLKDAGNTVATTVYKAFFYPNPSCETVRGKTTYSKNISVQSLISLINEPCGSGDVYSYSYMPVISFVAGGFLVFIILGFTVDIAIRAIKLSVLRVIAPVPIVTYIDPKSAKDGAFANWVKTLTSTYIDLFIRLVIIYFVIFTVNELTKNFPAPEEENFIINSLTMVFVIIGAFFFAKQAPKFFKDMLGVKGGSSNIGLAGMLGGTAALIGGAGLAGAGAAMMANANGAADAVGQGKQFTGGWAAGRDLAAQLRTGDKNAKGGIVNRMQQGAVHRAGERMASRYGLTEDNVQFAKDNMYKTAEEAGLAKDTYDRFTGGKMSAAEEAGLASHFGHFDTATGNMVMDDNERERARKYLYDDMSNKESAAGRAKAKYEKADKARESLVGSDNVRDKYDPGYRARRRQNQAEARRNAARPAGSSYTEPANHTRGSDHFNSRPV